MASNGDDFAPSLLYAIAACLEGCSFVNAASQDTLCPGLCELAEKNKAYCLGTDFKAGQTKFKTQVVEYLEHLNFNVRVVASSNHSGQQRHAHGLRVKMNLNLPGPREYASVSRECRSRAGNLALGSATQEKTRKAKLRVKSQIFHQT